MTKQASAPPTGDKGTPGAPPPPPAWRHYLWLIAMAVFIALSSCCPRPRRTSRSRSTTPSS